MVKKQIFVFRLLYIYIMQSGFFMLSKLNFLKLQNSLYTHNTRQESVPKQFGLSKDTVSFSQVSMANFIESIKTKKSNSQKILEFSDKLLSNANLNKETLKYEVQNFLKANSINNLKIDDISKITQGAQGKITGKFVPEYSSNCKLSSGTLYLGEIPNTSDKDAFVAYCSTVCHELLHVLQYAQNEDKFGLGEVVANRDEMKKYNDFSYFFMSMIEPLLINKPLQGIMNNYKKHGITEQEYNELFSSVNKNGFPILNKTVHFTENDIKTYITGLVPFDDYIDTQIKKSIEVFEIRVATNGLDSQTITKALLKNYIVHFKNELEAYSLMSDIVKRQYNLNDKTINDITPVAYKMVINVLERKLDDLSK